MVTLTEFTHTTEHEKSTNVQYLKPNLSKCEKDNNFLNFD